MKYLRLSLLTIFLMLTLTACSAGKDKDITVDINKLSDEIQSQAVTTDKLVKSTDDNFASTYFVDMSKAEESIAYLSSATTACEVAVVKCKDSAYVSEVEKLFKTRATNQSKLFATYNTTEAAKLDSAIIKTAGNYVVLCVVDDNAKAEEILKNYGF